MYVFKYVTCEKKIFEIKIIDIPELPWVKKNWIC